jgi:hypothetical protein
LGKPYADYATNFTKWQVDGYWLLNQITDEILEKYGITCADHRQAILEKIDEIKETQCSVNDVLKQN